MIEAIPVASVHLLIMNSFRRKFAFSFNRYGWKILEVYVQNIFLLLIRLVQESLSRCNPLQPTSARPVRAIAPLGCGTVRAGRVRLLQFQASLSGSQRFSAAKNLDRDIAWR